MSYFKNHPFAVEAHFKSSIVLTFAVEQEQLAPLIPSCLRLDTFDDKWAFLAIAMVQTEGLRPKGFPAFLGNDFFLIGYRIFVRYTTSAGKNLRGLYIIKSETDSKRMEFAGNLFTHYNYTTTDILLEQQAEKRRIFSEKSNFSITIDDGVQEAPLPVVSPFTSWKEARRYAGPLPFTFTYQESEQSVLLIEGVRSNWEPKPIAISDYHVDFLDKLPIENPILANAFEIEDIPYYWKKGKIDRWKA